MGVNSSPFFLYSLSNGITCICHHTRLHTGQFFKNVVAVKIRSHKDGRSTIAEMLSMRAHMEKEPAVVLKDPEVVTAWTG